MRTLERLRIRNFKSIHDQTLELRGLNVFIGSNGSGKSNLIGVFHLLNRISSQELQTYVGQAGGADRILHFGRKVSAELAIEVSFAEGKDANGYDVVLSPTADDRFIFRDERVWYHDKVRYPKKPYDQSLGGGHQESRLPPASDESRISRHVRADLQSYRIYHFHDTSAGARVKQTGDLEDNRTLAGDAGNLAAFLYGLRHASPTYYQNIEDAIRLIAPFFAGFDLEPSKLNPGKIRLAWREAGGGDALFGPEALSDGTLRFICLATLFLQPTPPRVILIDEPELGLHPAAVVLLSELLRSAATHCQILIATQSVSLVNQFEPQHIWVVDRENNASVFKSLEREDMSGWMDNYALGDLWEKNVLGGRP